MEIKTILNKEEYSFLKKEEIYNHLILLTFGGSISYGTNLETSDIDIRGICLDSKKEILGLANIGINKMEQIEDKNTDTVIYKLSKITKLLMNCNPNTIEILFTLPEHKIVNELGQQLIDNREIFLSQLAAHAFNGYAISQLHRLENALSRDGKLKIKDELIYECDRLNNMINHFNNVYSDFKYGGMNFLVDYENTKILINNNLQNYPLEDLESIYSEIKSVMISWNKYKKLKEREKDAKHLNKHAMHLIRLYMMGIDILLENNISTYRNKDNEHLLLMDIRNGKYLKNDGTYDSEFFKLVKDYQRKFEDAKVKTKLPLKCDYKKVDKLFTELQYHCILDDYKKIII